SRTALGIQRERLFGSSTSAGLTFVASSCARGKAPLPAWALPAPALTASLCFRSLSLRRSSFCCGSFFSRVRSKARSRTSARFLWGFLIPRTSAAINDARHAPLLRKDALLGLLVELFRILSS